MNQKDTHNLMAGTVMVVGGGIAGIHASLELADAGFSVCLAEAGPAIGGNIAPLDRLFSDNRSANQILARKFKALSRHPQIEILTNTVLEDVSGETGHFSVTLKKLPRYVDEAKCIACGVCASYCPVPVPDPYNGKLADKRAIQIPYQDAFPRAYRVNPDYCLFLTRQECKQCTRTCSEGAIDFDQKPETLTYQAGAIILTPGFSEFDPARIPECGYSDAANVITTREFERICSDSEPYKGKIVRPSDMKRPGKIAMVLCVGSRDSETGSPYCSSVCCKTAIKEAVAAKERDPGLDITIFYTDIRVCGKGFEAILERARTRKVKFVRARLSEITGHSDTGDLTLRYTAEGGRPKDETFHLTVLANGLEGPGGGRDLASLTGIRLNPYGFCETALFSPVQTSREGIFGAGAFTGPKSVSESLIQAGAAAASVTELLASSRSQVRPPEADTGETPKIGIFICSCGANAKPAADSEAIRTYAETLADVVISETDPQVCFKDNPETVQKAVAEHKLNRILLIECTMISHEKLFQDILNEAGADKYVIETVNIADYSLKTGIKKKDRVVQNAKILIQRALTKIGEIRFCPDPFIPVTPAALIIGGGLSGMTAALSLARQGFDCYLAERASELGGTLRHTGYTLEGEDPREVLDRLIRGVTEEDRIQVFTGADIKTIEGAVGKFRTVISADRNETEINHGVVILATGAEPYKPDAYLYGNNENILLQQTLEERMALGELNPENLNHLVMIQCVGSRDKTHPYCSGICCKEAVKNALKLREHGVDVTILYRDIVTCGFSEDYDTLAKKKGVRFIRYAPEGLPKVEDADGKLSIMIQEISDSDKEIVLDADMMVLSTAMVPRENTALIEQLAIPLSDDKFFAESYTPSHTQIEGIYVCGMAHFPKPVEERIAHAKAAASSAGILLARGYYPDRSAEEEDAEVVEYYIDETLCIGCTLCAKRCPEGAISGEKKSPHAIDSEMCIRCGICYNMCKQKAVCVR